MSEFVDTKKIYKKHLAKLKKIKCAVFDVDGILTDGKVYYAGAELGFNRFFHILDGYGLKILMQMGLEVAIISGGDSLGINKRFKLLGIKHIYFGNEEKTGAYKNLKEKLKLKDEQILYMADEFFDVPLLKAVGFAVTVPHASPEVRAICDYVTKRKGGEGAAREVIDMLRHVHKFVPKVYNEIV